MEFDEKFYEEDEFDEGTGSTGGEGGTHETSNDGGEPGSQETDLTTEILKIRGISDPSKIKFDDNGAVVERAWDDLSKEEQLNIIVGDQTAEDNELSEDEAALLNAIRKSGGSVQDFMNSYVEYHAPQQTTPEPSYQINELSDDEVYALDLLEKVGSENITDEELEQAVNAAKQNEELYKKTVEGLRQEYIRLQQDREA